MSTSTRFRRIAAAAAASGLLATCLTSTSAVAHSRGHAPQPGAPGAVVLDWNRISLRTFAERTVPVPVQALYAGFVGAAVSNAVLTIEGGYRPYLPQDPAAPGASVEAAASTAAYRVLTALLPASEAALAADRDRWLAQVTDPAARAAGVEVGADAAAALLAAREGDGRGAPITLVTTPGPGVWDPPPTGMLAPWMGFVRPMVVPSPTWLRLVGTRPADQPGLREGLRGGEGDGCQDRIQPDCPRRPRTPCSTTSTRWPSTTPGSPTASPGTVPVHVRRPGHWGCSTSRLPTR